VTQALDAHAWAIHESAYDEVMRAIDAIRHPAPDHPLASDQFVVPLQGRIPTYACFPNLAWQSLDPSDLTGTEYSFYDKGGTQTISPQVLEGMMTACYAPEVMERPPKLGLLFLTRDDVNHPEIWREWIGKAPGQVRMFTHAKNPNKDVTWTHWPEKGAGSPADHDQLAGEQLVSFLRSGAIFARKFPGGADVGRYRLHLE